MSIKWVIGLLVGLATIIYPFFIYYGLSEYGPSVFALILFVLMVIRVVVKGSYQEPSQWLQLLIIGIFCCAIILFKSDVLLRFYPVIMSLGFSLLFAISLTSKTTLVERFAKMAGQDYPQQALGYMRSLTKVWAIILFFNAMIAAYTACCASLKSWTLYNGFLAYFLLGGFVLFEYIFRCYYRRRFED